MYPEMTESLVSKLRPNEFKAYYVARNHPNETVPEWRKRCRLGERAMSRALAALSAHGLMEMRICHDENGKSLGRRWFIVEEEVRNA